MGCLGRVAFRLVCDIRNAVPTWGPGDTIPLGNDRTLRVIEIRPGPEPDAHAALLSGVWTWMQLRLARFANALPALVASPPLPKRGSARRRRDSDGLEGGIDNISPSALPFTVYVVCAAP
jgi:hypothetical protein